MLNWLGKRIPTIRGKLIGGYMLASLLFTAILSFVMAVALALSLTSPQHLEQTANYAQQIADDLAPQFEAGQRAPQQVGQNLREASSTINANPPIYFSPSGSLGDTSDPAAFYAVVVTGSRGLVITSTHPLDYPYGSLLGIIEPPRTRQLLASVGNGARDWQERSGWIDPQRQPAAVGAIRNRQGELIGMVYLRLFGFPSFASILAVFQPLVVGFSLTWLAASVISGLIASWLVGRGLAKRIKRLATVTAAMTMGDRSQRVDDDQPDEVGQLARDFNQMADQINQQLTELRTLADQNAALAQQNAQLATLEERTRVARELHDGVSQELFSLHMLAAAARRQLDRKPEVAALQIEQVQQAAQRALRETRSLIFALRPANLEGRGLGQALHELATSLQQRQGFQVSITISTLPELTADHEQVLFRIAQEALANAERHSHASSAELRLWHEQAYVILEIVDHGKGFDPHIPRRVGSYGLGSMEERAIRLGGSCQIESQPGQGTTVTVRLPVINR